MAKYNITSTIPNKDPNAPKMRVEEELTELNAKLQRLRAFTITESFQNLKADMQELLKRQIEVMEEYSDILNERLKIW